MCECVCVITTRTYLYVTYNNKNYYIISSKYLFGMTPNTCFVLCYNNNNITLITVELR